MDMRVVEYVEFRVDDQSRFDALCKVFNALRTDKQNETFRPADEWLVLFEQANLSYFWWPTNQERDTYMQRWFAIPWYQRTSDPYLQRPWEFTAMIEAFENGDYELVNCRLISPDLAHLEYYPLGFPYGGTECMKALIEAFGFQVTGMSDYYSDTQLKKEEGS